MVVIRSGQVRGWLVTWVYLTLFILKIPRERQALQKLDLKSPITRQMRSISNTFTDTFWYILLTLINHVDTDKTLSVCQLERISIRPNCPQLSSSKLITISQFHILKTRELLVFKIQTVSSQQMLHKFVKILILHFLKCLHWSSLSDIY